MADSAYQPNELREFYLRRLHSLLGIFPIGIFLIMHLSTNFLIVTNTDQTDYFQQQVERIHIFGPFLIPIEVLFIFIPITLHAVLGVKFWLEGRNNVVNYQYWGNIRYTLQRATGIIAMIFIVIHLWHMHWLGAPLPGGHNFDPEHATETASYAMQAGKIWTIPFYTIGVVSACFHLANGIWTFLITWGVTIGKNAQRKIGYICAFIGIMLTLTGWIALTGFIRNPNAAPKQSSTQNIDIEKSAQAQSK